MPALDERRHQDVAKIRDLARRAGDRLQISRITGDPPLAIELLLRFKTAGSRDYPNRVQESSNVKIDLPARYPFVEPLVNFTTPIFHPNVWSSGRVCLGAKWVPSQGLDLLVEKLIQIITFDPTILNEASPANGDALSWYRGAKARHPSAFPTDAGISRTKSDAGGIQFSDMTEQRVVVSCSHCGKQSRVPGGRSGTIKCAHCGEKFEVSA